jgi:hypothetical protein
MNCHNSHIISLSTDDPFNPRNPALPPQALSTLSSFTDTLRFLLPTIEEVSCQLHLILLSLGIWVDPPVIFHIAMKSRGDLRHCLMEAEFWLGHGFKSSFASFAETKFAIAGPVKPDLLRNDSKDEGRAPLHFTAMKPGLLSCGEYDGTTVPPRMWKWEGKVVPSLALEAGVAVDRHDALGTDGGARVGVGMGSLLGSTGALPWTVRKCEEGDLVNDAKGVACEKEMIVLEAMSKFCELAAWSDMVLGDNDWVDFEVWCQYCFLRRLSSYLNLMKRRTIICRLEIRMCTTLASVSPLIPFQLFTILCLNRCHLPLAQSSGLMLMCTRKLP